MIRKYLLPLIALLGALTASVIVSISNKRPPVMPILFPPPAPPYTHYVAASGSIEAASENIAIGTSFNELIETIYVKVGDEVKQGTSLFKVDTRALEASLSETEEEKKRAITSLANASMQFSFYENLSDKSAVSKSSYEEALTNYLIAKNEVAIAEAKIFQILTDIAKSTVVAPMDGTVLQIASHIGETANINPYNQQAIMLFGNLDTYHIRVSVDEEDSWRIQKGKRATAYVRGNSSIEIPLEFLYIEPFIIPKQSLTGSNQERVDTRVLQIIYRFSKNSYPIYVGQLLDVFIEALPEDKRFDE